MCWTSTRETWGRTPGVTRSQLEFFNSTRCSFLFPLHKLRFQINTLHLKSEFMQGTQKAASGGIKEFHLTTFKRTGFEPTAPVWKSNTLTTRPRGYPSRPGEILEFCYIWTCSLAPDQTIDPAHSLNLLAPQRVWGAYGLEASLWSGGQSNGNALFDSFPLQKSWVFDI